MENKSFKLSCPCKSCILSEILKLEQKQLYKEADLILNEAVRYYSQLLKDLENERENLRARIKKNSTTLQSNQNTSKNVEKNTYSTASMNVSHKSNALHRFSGSSKRNLEISCPVALFENPPNPKQKPMYPKNLVYADGKDKQLEEIRAAMYWNNVKEKNLEIQTKSEEQKEVQMNNMKVDVLQKNKLQIYPISKKSSNKENISPQGSTPVEKKIEKRTDITDDISEILKQLWSSPVANTTLGVFNRSCKILETRPEPKEKCKLSVLSSCDHDQKNILAVKTSPVWKDEDEDVNSLDNTCITKAFAVVLPSSTPNHRRSQTFQLLNSNGLCPVETKSSLEKARQSTAGVTIPNLSMILEMSKERSSNSSSSSSTNNIINSKTCVLFEKIRLSTVSETEEKNESTPKFEDFSDPFNPNLIEYFLHKIKSRYEESNGFCRIDTCIPAMKLSSTIKLGAEKYTIINEIGKGSYAKIWKVHITNKSSKTMALKVQKPACVWEYYISKEIHRRLNSVTQSRYFIHYSHVFVFNNGSALLSKWAPHGSLLNFVNNLKSVNYRQFQRPDAVATYLSIQLISAIEYLHSCQIIHGDIKPDNFVVFFAGNGKPNVQLIDYGRSIDMTLYPKDTVFHKVITTEDFTCNEMKENKPWTYQTDLFGLAGTMYLLLVREYMKTIKQNKVWILKKSLPRYMHKEIWDPIFETLLNISSCHDLPNLTVLKEILQQFYDSMDTFTVDQQFNKVFKFFKK